MAPAEIHIFRSGIGPENTKVLADDAQEFKIDGIEIDVDCHVLDRTEIDFSGEDLSFIFRDGGEKVSTSGNMGEGKIKTFLRGKNDSVEIRDRRARSRIKITHT